MRASAALFALTASLWLGCQGPRATPASRREGGSYTPLMAIEAAAQKTMGVQGTFELRVKKASYGSDTSKDYVFLNSEEDYRDRRCLTIRLMPGAVRACLKGGIDPVKHFNNKTIVVKGVAEQVKIHFVSERGVLSDKYYYQTHVQVRSLDQVTVLPD